MPTIIGQHRTGGIKLRSQRGTVLVEETYDFIVQADYANQPYVEIVQTSGLPVVNVTRAAGGLAVCRSKTADRRQNAILIYDVKCEFSSEVEENSDQQGDPATPPDTWIPVYETKMERLSEIASKDQSGATIANSAGVPFETGLVVSRFIPVWSFSQFEPSTVTDEQIIARNEVVNSGMFKGRAAKTLLCTVESSTIGFYYGRRMRLTYYSLKYNVKKWTHKRLDVGTTYKSGTDLLDYTSTDGTVILGALNGSGAKQAVGTAPAVLEFDMYATSSFSFLRV